MYLNSRCDFMWLIRRSRRRRVQLGARWDKVCSSARFDGVVASRVNLRTRGHPTLHPAGADPMRLTIFPVLLPPAITPAPVAAQTPAVNGSFKPPPQADRGYTDYLVGSSAITGWDIVGN